MCDIDENLRCEKKELDEAYKLIPAHITHQFLNFKFFVVKKIYILIKVCMLVSYFKKKYF